MMIQVNADSKVEVGVGLTDAVRTAVRGGLNRYGDRLTRVEVHLTEDGGHGGDSRTGTQCLLEARPAGLDPVVVTGVADTVVGACTDATRKMQRRLDSTFGRIDRDDGR